jgi:hypothetical protein
LTHKIGRNKKRTQDAKELKALKLQATKELGFKLRADGLSFRDTHLAVLEAGFKISYDALFKLLKEPS